MSKQELDRFADEVTRLLSASIGSLVNQTVEARVSALQQERDALRAALEEATELVRRRLARAVGDCQVYWDYDAEQFLKRAALSAAEGA